METESPTVTPTPASAWKGKTEIAGTDLLLPSGNVARVRRLSPAAFLTPGVIPDPLTEIVHKAIHDKSGLPPEKMAALSKDPEKIQASLELFDRVLAFVLVAPVAQMPPKCVHPIADGEVCNEYYNVDGRHANPLLPEYHPYQEGPRDPNVLYCDTVILEDKIFVFQFSMGGTRDLETFRAKLSSNMGDLLNGPNMARPA